ncbi:MAG: hypothetical protein MRK02_10600 [Candidatus Scalindua sp.]|nr:hypothetical protein [Candidatus Scalindua sp.]
MTNKLIDFAKRDGRVYYFNGQMPIFVHDESDLESFKWKITEENKHFAKADIFNGVDLYLN